MLTLLLAVATWRITRLLVRDEFPPIRNLRDWIIRTMAIINPDGDLTGGRQLVPDRRIAIGIGLAAGAFVAILLIALVGPLPGAMEVPITLGAGVVAGFAVGGLVGSRAVSHAVAYLWTCPWCMSVWVAAGLVWVADWRLSVPLPWLVVGAGAALTGVLTWVENEHDQRWWLRRNQINREGR
jgi:hypothetical protein